MSQPPKQSAVGSWENSSEVLSSWRLFGSERAEPQRTIPFFCWDRAAFFGRTRGREYSKFKIFKRKMPTRAQKGALSLHLFISFFRVTSLHHTSSWKVCLGHISILAAQLCGIDLLGWCPCTSRLTDLFALAVPAAVTWCYYEKSLWSYRARWRCRYFA